MKTLSVLLFALLFVLPAHADTAAVAGTLVSDNRVSLDFDEHVGVDQGRYFNHGRRWMHLAKYLAVSTANSLPLADICHIYPGPNHIGQTGTGVLERPLDNFETSSRLDIGIADTDDLTILTNGCGTGNRDMGANPDRAAIADN
jgi:hypothetical protein